MIFLGNAASFHLQTWRNIYALCGEPVTALHSIHPVKGDFPEECSVTAPVKFLAYAALGLRLSRLSSDAMLHAHGASGYGFAALLSGRRYIATIYGSEILRPQRFVYRRMMRAILKGAAAITVTSIAARDRIVEIDRKVSEKTFLFHTGIDTRETAEVEIGALATSGDKLRIMLVRNVAPHYRTREVLSAVSEAIGDRKDIEVIIPIGNGDKNYFSHIRSLFPDSRFTFLDQSINHSDYLGLIATSDICINFPISDQVSTSLLESLYFDRIVVTNRLEAYADLLDLTKNTGDWIVVNGDNTLVGAISDAVARSMGEKKRERLGRRIVTDHFSIENAARRFRLVLDRS